MADSPALPSSPGPGDTGPSAPITITSSSQRDALMGALRSGKIPDDIAAESALAIKNYDANAAKTQADFTAQQQSLGVMGRFGQAVGDDADAHIMASKILSDAGPEAGIRAVENLGQTGLNALNLVSGAVGMRNSLINPVGNAAVSDFNASVVQRRSLWADDMQAKYGDVPMTAAANIGAGILASPLFMARGSLLLKAADETKFLPTLAQESARNALFAGSDFDPKALSLLDKAGAMTAGALFPVAITSAGAAYDVMKATATLGGSAGEGLASQGLKNNLVRTILRRQDPDSVRGAQQASDFFQSTGTTPANSVPLSMGQLTGDPRIISYENRFADVKTRDFQKTQSTDLLNAAEALRSQLNGQAGGGGIHAVGQGTYDAIDKVDGALRLQRANDWDAGTANVKAVVAATQAATGQPVKFPMTNTVKAFNDITQELNNPAAMADPSVKDRIVAFGQLLTDAQNKGGTAFSAGGIMGMLQGFSAGKKYAGNAAGGAPGGADAALEAIRGRLMEAVYQDAAAGGQNTSAVTTAIADMRQRYQTQSEGLRRLQNDTMTQLFGNKDVLADPAAATDAFLKLDPSAQAYGVKILQQRAPQVLYGMQSRILDNAIDSATKTTQAAMTGQFDVNAFNQALYGSGAAKSGVMTPDTLKTVDQAKGYLASILNNKQAVVRPGTQIWPEDVAINVISRSPEFMARAVTRVMTGLNAEKLFVTPEGVSALRTVANLRNVPKEAGVAAATWLGSLMEDDSRRTQAAQAQAAASQHQQDQQNNGK